MRRALERFGDPAEIAFCVPIEELSSLERFPRAAGPKIADARGSLRRRAERELERAARLGVRIISCEDADYPSDFENLRDPPVVIYVKGQLPECRVRVAVVGSRVPTAYGRKVATGLAAGLAGREIQVVSGGARGIDACAHEGALAAAGTTLAVLGSGLARPYPPEHVELFERIAASGSLVSEFALDEPPQRENFPRRNRLLAAFSAAVVVVEAGAKSGALITAGHALELGRDVLAVPGPVTSELSHGCHRLIQEGAKLVQQLDDVLDELSPMYREALARGSPAVPAEVPPDLDGLGGDEAVLLGLLDPVEPVQVDELAERAPFGVARVQAALFGLELRRAVEQLPGRYYLSRPPKEP
ncbi:MAG TPA: DNA-processing protein DprA [Candidatus Polarisedimenticolaceae bacterium]|nr:DNA-processing protein DprA [Candidatus Polarisedimenticolaceae bacterium]